VINAVGYRIIEADTLGDYGTVMKRDTYKGTSHLNFGISGKVDWQFG
jgi:hypothetical protein